MPSSFLVFASAPTGKKRRIDLAGIDLLMVCINNVFVYPSDLNVERFKEALDLALHSWPLVAGRFLLLDLEHYVIEMSDNGIPLSVIDNTDLSKWPLNHEAAMKLGHHTLQSYVDEVQVGKMGYGSLDEPLFRVKLTRFTQSGEWVMGISWAHVLGDAASLLNFLNTLSRFYQEMKPLEPAPIFERRLWNEDKADQSLLPLIKHLRDTVPKEQATKALMDQQNFYDQVNMCFSGEQLAKLRTSAGSNGLTMHDALIAYIIRTLNIYCFRNDDQRRILRARTVFNFRGVDDSIAPKTQVGNAVFMILSDDFDDPHSLPSIAKTIRRSIVRTRDKKFLESLLATADGLRRAMVRDNRMIDGRCFAHEIIVNSNFRFDWASLVDFGHTDKCRFYTDWLPTLELNLRVYRLNPVYDGTHWTRDHDGAEVAFLIAKDLKEKFMSASQHEIMENFENVN